MYRNQVYNTRYYAQMLFKSLPLHIVIEICEYLDDKSLMSALNVFNNWTDAVATSTKLMNKFCLNLDEEFFHIWRVNDLPNIPVKNIAISAGFRSRSIAIVLKKYKTSIISMEFFGFYITNTTMDNFINIVGAAQITRLKLHRMNIYTPYANGDVDYDFNLPNLTHLTTVTMCDRYEKMQQMIKRFKHNESIERLHLESDCCCLRNLPPGELNDFVSTLPNLKHFVLKDQDGFEPPVNANFPTKLESLEINPLFDADHLGFLRSQNGNLLDLKIVQGIQYGQECMDILRFIFKEMKLRSFECNDVMMIENYERQPASFQYRI